MFTGEQNFMQRQHKVWSTNLGQGRIKKKVEVPNCHTLN